MENQTQPNDLEAAVNAARGLPAAPAPTDSAAPQAAPETGMNAQEEIGFHKGALNTLIAERTELVKMVGNVEAIMQAHISRLKELGVDVTGGEAAPAAQ